jgi:hypothetical protein
MLYLPQTIEKSSKALKDPATEGTERKLVITNTTQKYKTSYLPKRTRSSQKKEIEPTQVDIVSFF